MADLKSLKLLLLHTIVVKSRIPTGKGSDAPWIGEGGEDFSCKTVQTYIHTIAVCTATLQLGHKPCLVNLHQVVLRNVFHRDDASQPHTQPELVHEKLEA